MEDEIRRYLCRDLIRDPDMELGSDEPIFSSGLLSSLSVIRLMHFLEDRYGISISIGSVVIDDFDTLARIQSLVVRLKAEGKT